MFIIMLAAVFQIVMPLYSQPLALAQIVKLGQTKECIHMTGNDAIRQEVNTGSPFLSS